MAETRNTVSQGEQSRSERGTLQRSSAPGREIARWDPLDIFSTSPFGIFRRMQEDMDRLFAGFGRHGLISPFGEEAVDWSPAIEAFHRGNEFVVRADVPGLSRNDLNVEVGEDRLTIRGERKYDKEEEREGVYRSERAYGSFCRVISLPEGAVADSAKANFADGVLEVVLQSPSQEVRRGRKIEISEEKSRK
jgi:HSP20 family protein